MGSFRELVLKFKFHHGIYLTGFLSRLLAERLQRDGIASEIDGVLPVPMHWYRYLKRGYNPSELLSERIAKLLRLPLLRGALRSKQKLPQSLLTGTKRRQNVVGCFQITKPKKVLNKRLLLVDDVLTTGATANECTKSLLSAGAERVYVAVLAR
jgi:ComF family protein